VWPLVVCTTWGPRTSSRPVLTGILEATLSTAPGGCSRAFDTAYLPWAEDLGGDRRDKYLVMYVDWVGCNHARWFEAP